MSKKRILNSLTYIALPLVFLGIQGCVTVGVDHKEPNMVVPDAWNIEVVRDMAANDSSLNRWWESFNDPTLNELIKRTREANPSLRIASQRIAESRALRGATRSQLYPNLNTDGAYARNQASENLFQVPSENPSDYFNIGFDAGWEFDAFGGIRRSIEAADASIEVSEEAYRDLLVTLLAETALNYIQYRTLEERLKLAELNLDSQTKSVEISQQRLEAGLAPKIDVTQANASLELNRSFVPLLKSNLAIVKARLAVLTGDYTASIDPILRSSKSGIPTASEYLVKMLPSELIRARPDIRKAERQLAAQTAKIGIATADLYPRFSLFGSFDLESIDGSDLFNSSSNAYSFGPAFRWKIFSAGKIRSQILVEETRAEQALINYEKTVLEAVSEVETTIVALANEQDRQESLAKSVDAVSETVRLVKKNYSDGLVDFLRVIDSERAKFASEDEAALSLGLIAQIHVRLYKALGGGNSALELPTPTAPRITKE